jgi:hypothetical protein
MGQKKIHPNRMRLGPWNWTRTNGDRDIEEIKKEYSIGSIFTVSSCPYIAVITDCVVVRKDSSTVEVSLLVEPATIEQSCQKRGDPPLGQRLPEESEQEQREREAEQVTWELWQQSWLDGVPADATIFCDAHQSQRPAHGANRYDRFLLCNQCVGTIEKQMALHALFSINDWVVEYSRISRLQQAIDHAEQ